MERFKTRENSIVSKPINPFTSGRCLWLHSQFGETGGMQKYIDESVHTKLADFENLVYIIMIAGHKCYLITVTPDTDQITCPFVSATLKHC